MRRFAIAAALVATIAVEVSTHAADPKKTPPYYASINAGRARMRTGPARTYPASWLYQRAGLPIKIVAVYQEWRKLEDPDGTTGWMQANLLSEARTAMVTAKEPVEMRDRPSTQGKLLWRAAPGVVGRISNCADNWCRFDVKGQAGYVETSGLWGVDPGEKLP